MRDFFSPPDNAAARVASSRPATLMDNQAKGKTSPWYAWAIVLGFEAIMAFALVPLVGSERWGNVLVTIVVMVSVLSPTAAKSRLPVQLPIFLDLAIAAFVFATLFLGQVAGFYDRFAWWDMLLHGSSGVLFSAIGLPLAYALQRSRNDAELAPRVAFLFAPMFAMSIGTFWEVFEFVLQNISGLPVQVPRLSGESGLTDTMGDMILNATGAIAVAIYGWHVSRPGSDAGIPTWVARFLRHNPGFLRSGR